MSEQTAVISPAQKKKRRRRRIRRLILWIIILLLLALAGLIAYGRLKQEYTVTYDAYTAMTGSISNSLSFSGSLSLVDSATYTVASEATVRAVNVAAGDHVTKGEKLIRLSTGEVVEAEFDGTVNVLDAAKGDTVHAGDSLIQIADFDHLKVNLRVDEYDISDVAVGMDCTVTVTAIGESYPSVIDSINYISSSSGSVAYYTVTCHVDVSSSVNAHPGMQVTVTVPKEEATDVVVLKMDALSFDYTNSAFVYKMQEDGTMAASPVTVGVSNGNYVEIRSGVESGETIYAEAEAEAEATGLASLFSSMFGSQRVNSPGRGMSMPGGSGGMPGGSWPSRDGGSGGSGMPGGSGGSSGGGGSWRQGN